MCFSNYNSTPPVLTNDKLYLACTNLVDLFKSNSVAKKNLNNNFVLILIPLCLVLLI